MLQRYPTGSLVPVGPSGQLSFGLCESTRWCERTSPESRSPGPSLLSLLPFQCLLNFTLFVCFFSDYVGKYFLLWLREVAVADLLVYGSRALSLWMGLSELKSPGTDTQINSGQVLDGSEY